MRRRGREEGENSGLLALKRVPLERLIGHVLQVRGKET